MALTQTELRAGVRDLIASGELPSERPVVHGTGAAALGSRSAHRRLVPDTCLICREPEPTVSYVWTDGRVASLHATCDALWKQEQSDSG